MAIDGCIVTNDALEMKHKRGVSSPATLLTPLTPLSDQDVASIISEARRSAQSLESTPTSGLLYLSGGVLVRGSKSVLLGSSDESKGNDVNDHHFAETFMSPVRFDSSSSFCQPSNSAPTTSTILREESGKVALPHLSANNSPASLAVNTSFGMINIPSLSTNTSMGLSIDSTVSMSCASPRASPLPSPLQTPSFDDSLHLPGKFCSLSSAEVEKKYTSSPIKRIELLKKLDGLDRLVPSSSSVEHSLSNCSSVDASDGMVGKIAPSISAVNKAMKSAHAHANRIKKSQARRKYEQHGSKSRGISIGNGSNGFASITSGMLKLAVDESANERSCSSPCSEAMPMWVQRKVDADTCTSRSYAREDDGSDGESFGQYELNNESETMIVHVLNRGDWTWAIEWSRDGRYLALATENHGLAIVEAGNTDSPTWKVVHDERIEHVKNDTTHTIRSIAWGANFIALGGTGDAVSIVEPLIKPCNSDCGGRYSFCVVEIITQTGFVGSLSWLKNSNILAIGSRQDQCLIAEVVRSNDGSVSSSILHNIERSDWVTSVQFSHCGTKLAIGDRSGLLSVYLFVMIRPGEAPALSPLQDIKMPDAILDIQWSKDGEFLYVGGEDYSLTVLETSKYSAVQRIGMDRWVSFSAPSHGGSHIAAGGRSSFVSLLDVNNKWNEATSLQLEGGEIPLAAKWSSDDDKFLAICGQFNDVVIYESSCQRLQKGKCLRSKSPILAVEFSPDGSTVVIGNETGLVTFFDVDINDRSSNLSICYETVVGTGGADMFIKWTLDGNYVAITSGGTFVLLATSYYGNTGIHPESSAQFNVRKVIQSDVNFTSLTISPSSRWLVLIGDYTRILDLKNGCRSTQLPDQGDSVSAAWSNDGVLFATVGETSAMDIYDVNTSSPENWDVIFSISFKATITSLCWGSSSKVGLYYLAFGGENGSAAILEIRTKEKLWESVLQIPCNSHVNDLAWNVKGELCVRDDHGTISIFDFSYLQSGQAVSEMNYNWQRQGIISQMKLNRNHENAITAMCWFPSGEADTVRDYLAIGCSDGALEIVDLSAEH